MGLVLHSELHSPLAGTRQVGQLGRVSDQRIFEENKHTSPCIVFNKGSLNIRGLSGERGGTRRGIWKDGHIVVDKK